MRVCPDEDATAAPRDDQLRAGQKGVDLPTFVAVGTAESALHKIWWKSGFRSRTELAALPRCFDKILSACAERRAVDLRSSAGGNQSD